MCLFDCTVLCQNGGLAHFFCVEERTKQGEKNGFKKTLKKKKKLLKETKKMGHDPGPERCTQRPCFCHENHVYLRYKISVLWARQ